VIKQNSIGVLGYGYLGRVLFRQFPWDRESWVTTTYKESQLTSNQHPANIIHFEWHRPSTWENLPQDDLPIVLTIPPVHQERDQEKARVEKWCRWMKKHRPGTSAIVYISTTGVYPDSAGLWSEEMDIKPDTIKGGLRLDTEKVLLHHFDAKIIRSGAIYGPGRHIGLRVLNGKSIPKGQRPVHRVHVTDLARIVKTAISDSGFPPVVNAVDTQPASSESVVKWLFQQDFPQFINQQQIHIKNGNVSRKQQGKSIERKISNDLLIKKVRFQFQYPTYKEGFEAIANS